MERKSETDRKGEVGWRREFIVLSIEELLKEVIGGAGGRGGETRI